MANSIEPMRGASAPSTGRRRIDVKALMTMHLQPYAIVQSWQGEFEILKEHRTRFAKDVNGRVMALRDDQDWDERANTLVLACDLLDTLPPRDAIDNAEANLLAVLQAPFDERLATLLIGIMLDGMATKPGESAPIFVDAMIYLLEEHRLEREGDIAVPTAAIAAAVKDFLKAQTFKPSIHEMLDCVSKHWRKLLADWRAIKSLGGFVATLAELVPASSPGIERPEIDPEIGF